MEQLDSDRQQQSSISAIGASNSPDLVLKQASPFKIWLACLSTALHQENTIPDDFEILHSITASSSQPPPTTPLLVALTPTVLALLLCNPFCSGCFSFR